MDIVIIRWVLGLYLTACVLGDFLYVNCLAVLVGVGGLLVCVDLLYCLGQFVDCCVGVFTGWVTFCVFGVIYLPVLIDFSV